MRVGVLLVLVAACGRPAVVPPIAPAPAPRLVALPVHEPTAALVIARVGPDGVTPLGRADGGERFVWRDAHTLIIVGEEIAIVRDGQLVERRPMPEGWRDPPLLRLTPAGDVWLERCVRDDGPAGCVLHRARRALPTLDAEVDAAPGDARVVYDGDDAMNGRPPPPEVAAPPGATLQLRADGQTLECRVGAERAHYPSARWDLAAQSGYAITRARWVQTTPPIFEAAVDITTPVGTIFRPRIYTRACAPASVDDFVALGGDMYAVFEAPRTAAGFADLAVEGTWSFFAGPRPLGTLRGAAGLRANVLPDRGGALP